LFSHKVTKPFGRELKAERTLSYNMIHLMQFLINSICCIYSFSAIDSSLFDKVL